MYRGPQASSSHASGSQLTFSARRGESSQRVLSTPGPLPIAPKPSGSAVVSSNPTPSLTTSAKPTAEQDVYEFTGKANFTATPIQRPPHSISQAISGLDSIDHSKLLARRSENSPQHDAAHSDTSDSDANLQGSTKPPHPAPESTGLSSWSEGPTSASLTFSDELFYDSNSRYPATTNPRELYPTLSDWSHASKSSTSFPTSSPPQGGYNAPLPAQELDPKVDSFPQQRYQHTQSWGGEQLLGSDEVEHEIPESVDPMAMSEDMDSDDPFDVSDDDYNMDHDAVGQQALPADSCTMDDELGVMVTFKADQVSQDLALRSITSFIDRPNMLSTYVPSHRSSPLNNSMTARIFSHFINVTAATISMYERHPSNPSLIFMGTPIPNDQQHLWTCKLFRGRFLLFDIPKLRLTSIRYHSSLSTP